ncbi:MAG: nitroreductase [Thermoleophilia bacterium]
MPPGLQAALDAAVLAPSSHNTQPWRFRVDGDVLELRADRSRALPVNDPDDRELLMSCGAALMCARVGAAAAGFHLDLEASPDPADPSLVARARLRPGAGSEGELAPALERRRTHRGPMEPGPVDADALGLLREAAEAEGAVLVVLHGPVLVVLHGPLRDAFADLVGEATRAQFADAAWRRELAAWMRPSGAPDGLAQPLPARVVVPRIDLGRPRARADARAARRAPALAVLATAGDGTVDRLRAGQALARVLLQAAALGLAASHLNGPLQLPALRPRVTALLDRHPCAPQAALRIGVPRGATPRSGRRPVAEVVDGPGDGPRA